jgi:hypothetical protein
MILRITIIFLCLTMPICAGDHDYRDNLLPGAIEQCSLEDIFLALPSELFNLRLVDRAKRLRSEHTKIDDKSRLVVFEGDGAQATIHMKVVSWKEPDYIVHIDSIFEGQTEKIVLRRQDNGWKRIK